MRGIASTDVTEIGDPSVPIARDGFYTNRSYSIATSMYDIIRIEVLKGPQGTLNGRNSTGGLISLITNRPAMKSGGYGSFEAGNFGTLNGELGANIAASDVVQFRVSGILRHHMGYRNVQPINLRGDDQDVASGRVQLQLTPAEGLRLWASYQHDDVDEVGDLPLKSDVRVRPASFGNARNFNGVAETFNKLKNDRFRWEG